MSIEQTATTRRVTRPRLLITQVLAELSRFAMAQEITDILRERGTRIGTATAYRNVQMMASQGEFDVIHVNGEASTASARTSITTITSYATNAGGPSKSRFPDLSSGSTKPPSS